MRKNSAASLFSLFYFAFQFLRYATFRCTRDVVFIHFFHLVFYIIIFLFYSSIHGQMNNTRNKKSEIKIISLMVYSCRCCAIHFLIICKHCGFALFFSVSFRMQFSMFYITFVVAIVIRVTFPTLAWLATAAAL